MGERRTERGQGVLELVVMLPVLLILLFGVVEMGYALRNYLVVVNSDREGCRFAARGRFSDARVGERVVSAGGVVSLGDPPTDVPFLRTDIDSTDPNTGIIITQIVMDDSGTVISYTKWYSGVVSNGAGGVQAIGVGDSRVTQAQIEARHTTVTNDINDTRDDLGYERMDNHIVVVEIFFMHHPLWNSPFVPLPDPWMMYGQTEMRVITERGG